MRRIASLALGCAGALIAAPAQAVDIPDVGGETLTIDISNTTELAYRFDNRNDTQAQGGTTLNPSELVDDNYGEWFNRLYVRALYWKFSLGLRLDSAVYFETMDRQEAQNLIVDRLGAPDLELENRFGRELHSRYTSLIYPAKLWLGFKHKRLEVTVGDFYAQLGRGLVFSVRKIDEIGIDTTVRGAKIDYGTKVDDLRIEGTVFGGQLNPLRIDFPTGRILHGTDNPLFFGFPRAGAFEHYEPTGPDTFELRRDRPKPNYLEDTVAGAHLLIGPKEVQFEANGSALFRQSNSEEQVRCLAEAEAAAAAGIAPERTADDCRADFPAFSSPEATRSHDQIYTFGGAIRVPPIANVFDAYVEVAGQHQREGRVNTIENDEPIREDNLWGYAVYGNINVIHDPIAITLEGKHYRRFFSLGSNVDQVTPAFSGPEFNVVQYSRPPTASSIYTLFIGSPDNCMSGGRARLDYSLSNRFRVFGWLGHFVSFSEVDPNNNDCSTEDELRTNTWDAAAGTDFAVDGGKSHYIAWVGGRFQNHHVPIDTPLGMTEVFYREGNVRYDLVQHLAGDFSLSALGYHLFRYEPALNPEPWQEGENLLSLNWNPHWSFIFGVEYNTRDGVPDTYFNGSIQYRSKSLDTWYDRLTDLVRIYVGQRRSALRCVGGVCRIYPAFEGARFELASRF